LFLHRLRRAHSIGRARNGLRHGVFVHWRIIIHGPTEELLSKYEIRRQERSWGK
jgi:hypothetical protein